jgi:hypothetical protein
MTLIDSVLQTFNPEPTVYTQQGHNFKVGSALRLSDNGQSFVLADSTTESNAAIIGLVSGINGSTFTVKQFGFLNGIDSAFNLTAGTVYYLKAAADSVNLVPVGQIPVTALRVPVLIADSAASGYLLALNNGALRVMVAATGVASGFSGAVPAPPAGANTKFLRGDASWQDMMAAASLLLSHLSTAGTFVVNDWDAMDGSKSIYRALQNLDSRLRSGTFALYTVNGATQEYQFVIPEGYSRMRIRMAGGGGGAGSTHAIWTFNNGAQALASVFLGGKGGSGAYIEHIVSIKPGELFKANIGVRGNNAPGPSNGQATYFRKLDAQNPNIVLWEISAGGGTAGTSGSAVGPGTDGSGGVVTGTVLLGLTGTAPICPFASRRPGFDGYGGFPRETGLVSPVYGVPFTNHLPVSVPGHGFVLVEYF